MSNDNGTAPGAGAAAPAQHLTFLLGAEVFAMDLRAVREIVQLGPITNLPLMPGYVRGVVNLRGAALPVVDLQVRFGRPAAEVTPKSCIVVFDALRADGRGAVGLLVDAVREVIAIDAGAVEPPPQFGVPARREFVRGIGKVAGRFVILLDPDAVLTASEMHQLDVSADAAGAALASLD